MIKGLLLYMSEQPSLQRMATKMEVSRRVARRFVAGETIAEAITAVEELNKKGFSATLDYLGENITTREEAKGAADEYIQGLEAIQSASVNCNVSLKLTQFGLAMD